MIEALMIIGGVVGVGSVGLFVSGRMTKWWTSGLYALLTTSLGLLMVAGFYSLFRENDPTAILWYTRLAAIATMIALTCFYFLVQELVSEAEKGNVGRAVDRAVLTFGILVTALTFSPVVFSDAIIQSNDILISSDWGVLLLIVYVVGVFVLIGNQIVHMVQTAYQRRFGTFDIRFVIVRTISYFLTLLMTALMYMLAVFVLAQFFVVDNAPTREVLFNPVVIVAALIAALAFQPIKKIFNKAIDALLYRDNYSVTDFTIRVSQMLTVTNDLRSLLEQTSKEIAVTLKASQAFFYVQLLEGRYMTAGTDRHSKVVPAEFAPIKIGKSTSAKVLTPLQFEKNHPLRRMMVSHRLGLMLQLAKNGTIVGYLCLGHSQRAGYSARDIHALQLVADELTIAIQNALSVDEVRKLNDTLEQRVSSATKELRASNTQLQRLDEAKDEFISMASHQLRTPLTSIKGYVSMLLEGDAGKITKEQEHFLNEAFVSSERMVRLIGDFLNVSRLQTGKFVIEKRPVDLALLVQREIDGLTQNASARGITFTYVRPKSIPTLALDENKIQQVVMNFSDNAIYYSKDKSNVTVTLKKIPGFVEFKVVDTGIGVPKEEQEQLFNKFFRATNARRARPDGTGVGLFLAKKVIDEHDGTIIFESKEGVGSTFGFRLPIKK